MSTENNTSPQVWRVVVACNEVQPHTHTREVNVCRNHLGWFTSETTSLGLATSHAAVMEHVHEKRWPVVEIVAPGQPTRAELEAEVARLKQEVVYADRARRERHGMFSDLCADVTLLARDIGLLGADEEAPADRDPLREFMRHVQDTVRDQRSKVGDLEARNTDLTKGRDTALASSIALIHERDELRAILDGSATPPTDREIEEHAKADGRWLVWTKYDGYPFLAEDPPSLAAEHRRSPHAPVRWWAIDARGHLCARSVVEVSRGA